MGGSTSDSASSRAIATVGFDYREISLDEFMNEQDAFDYRAISLDELMSEQDGELNDLDARSRKDGELNDLYAEVDQLKKGTVRLQQLATSTAISSLHWDEDYANSSQLPEEFGFDRPLRQTVAEHAVQVSFVEDEENAYYSLFFLDDEVSTNVEDEENAYYSLFFPDDEVSTNGSSSKNPVNPLFDWQCTPGDEGYNFEDHLDDSKPAEEEPTIPSSLLQQPPTWQVP